MTFRRSAAALLCLVCLLMLGIPLLPAQEKGAALPEKPSAPPDSTVESSTSAPQAYTLPPDKLQKAIALARARNWLYFIDIAYALLILLLILHLRIPAKFRDWAERASANRILPWVFGAVVTLVLAVAIAGAFLFIRLVGLIALVAGLVLLLFVFRDRLRFSQAAIFAPLSLLTIDVLGLPPSIYGHWLSLKYEQSVQSWGSWFWDWIKGELIGFVVFIVLVWILYAVIRKSPRRWWFYFWMAAVPIIVFLIFLAPLLIDPLFFTFKPLEATQPQLVAEIGKAVKRGGLEIPRERMFESNASSKYKTVNAYVTGIGASKRVVVWDTTIQKMNTGQTLFVFGHEMGHYVLGHIRNALLFVSAVLLLFLYFGYRGLHWALRRWGQGWSIRGVDDWASFPVLMLFLLVFSFLFSPIFNGFSRWQEHNADIYGLEVIHGIVENSPEVAGQSFQILGEISLADPDPHPLIKYWRYSHPPVAERVSFARSYAPWSKGLSPKYVK